jgi:hypothetical protein
MSTTAASSSWRAERAMAWAIRTASGPKAFAVRIDEMVGIGCSPSNCAGAGASTPRFAGVQDPINRGIGVSTRGMATRLAGRAARERGARSRSERLKNGDDDYQADSLATCTTSLDEIHNLGIARQILLR